MITYVLTLECPTCDATMRERVADLSTGPEDELVIDLDLAVSQTAFDCHACGGTAYLGDLSDIVFAEDGPA